MPVISVNTDIGWARVGIWEGGGAFVWNGILHRVPLKAEIRYKVRDDGTLGHDWGYNEIERTDKQWPDSRKVSESARVAIEDAANVAVAAALTREDLRHQAHIERLILDIESHTREIARRRQEWCDEAAAITEMEEELAGFKSELEAVRSE